MGNVINPVRKLKNRFAKKTTNESETSADKLAATVDVINTMGYIVGVEFTNDWYFSSRSTFTLVVILFTLWMWLYSLYIEHKNLNCIVLFGGLSFILTCILKYLIVVWQHTKFMSLIDFVFKLFKQNPSGNRAFILCNTVDRITLHCKFVCAGVIFGLFVYAFYPCYDFLINGNLTLVAPLYVPFIDHTTVNGYLLVTAVNIFVASWGAVGSLFFSFMFLLCVDIYDGLVSLVEDDLREFDIMCEKNDGTSISRRKDAFKHITMELMDMVRYIDYMNELFSMTATVQMGACYTGIVICIFAYLVANYISGVGASTYYLTELMMFCSIGQLLDTTSTKVASVIYNSKWYTYETKYQKDLIFLLAIFQNVQPIMIANLYLLNFETGLEIIKNIYSMIMVMVNMLEVF